MTNSKQTNIEEPVIRFSHETYEKFKDIDIEHEMTLLEAFIKQKNELSKSFIDYDTTYTDKSGKLCQFKLRDGMYIILLLSDSSGRLLTTIRTYSIKKFDYYSSMRDKKLKFNIIETQT